MEGITFLSSSAARLRTPADSERLLYYKKGIALFFKNAEHDNYGNAFRLAGNL
jgi:hypothetical protein